LRARVHRMVLLPYHESSRSIAPPDTTKCGSSESGRNKRQSSPIDPDGNTTRR
jgi:hypothetical protein